MAIVLLRNNSESVTSLPPIADLAGVVPGPEGWITVRPGETVEVDSERLKLYSSPAFDARFKARNDAVRADLEVLGTSEAKPVDASSLLSDEERAKFLKATKKSSIMDTVK